MVMHISFLKIHRIARKEFEFNVHLFNKYISNTIYRQSASRHLELLRIPPTKWLTNQKPRYITRQLPYAQVVRVQTRSDLHRNIA